MSSDAVIAVDGLGKTFPAPRGSDQPVVAVDDVSFAVAAGESLAIVGESGSGKTTIARMLIGLEQPTAGRIVVCGRERPAGRVGAAERRRRGRELQIVFQDPYTSLDPQQTVGVCLAEVVGAQFALGRAERQQAVADLLEQVGLQPAYAASRPRDLSGGQRQRVAIARALAAKPQVLILDEAVAALDVSVQAQVLNLLADLREQTGMTYLFISHDLAVVRQVSDRVIVMHRGRIVEAGATADVLTAPADPYTRRLRAAVPGPGWTPAAATDA